MNTEQQAKLEAIKAKYKYTSPAAAKTADWFTATAPKPPVPKVENYVERVSSDISRNYEDMGNNLMKNETDTSFGSSVNKGLNIAKNVTGAAVAPIAELPPLKKLGEIFNAFGHPIADKLMQIPEYADAAKSVADFLDKNPGVSDAIETANNIAQLQGAKAAVEVGGPLVKAVATKGAEITSNAAKGTASSVKNAVGKVKEYVSPTPTVDELVGTVAQGKTGDVSSFKSGLESLDTSKVATYKDLNKASNDTISALSKEQDALLAKDTRVLKVQQLATKVGDTFHNYVNDAISQLKDYYTKTNDIPNLKKIQAYEQKLDPINGKGLTLQDVNNIAKSHGSDLNGYNANGELASGLTKQAAENTRMGLKTTVRSLLQDKASQALDAKISDLYTVKDLSSTMVEQVNKLTQRLQKPNILQKLGGILGKATRITGIGDFASKLLGIDKVPGAQTLNAVEIEAILSKNLARIKAAMAKDDAGFVQDIQDIVQNDLSTPETQSATRPSSASPNIMSSTDIPPTISQVPTKVKDK